MANKVNSDITPVERIKNLLYRNIVRYNHPDGWYKSEFMCIDSRRAITEIKRFYPELTEEQIFEVIGKHLDILKGTLTDFIGGQTKMARELSILINE